MSFWKVGLLEILCAGGESALVGVVIGRSSDGNRGQGRTDELPSSAFKLQERASSIHRPMPLNSCVVSVIGNLHAN